ncbi:hypothetical protein K2F43_08340 [Clostridium estertheticum]|nr:hypothetical protein [Clostridium estertheticum]MBW9171213.1 hypothetical protein [Clostridium estertheticum]
MGRLVRVEKLNLSYSNIAEWRWFDLLKPKNMHVLENDSPVTKIINGN